MYENAESLNPPIKRTPLSLAASSILGDTVEDANGEHLGKIEELMIDTEDGRIAYAVMSFGGFLGLGDKLFAIPWSSLRVNTAQQKFVLEADKAMLEAAPGFDKDNWPDMADPNWNNDIHRYYGQQPYWEG